MARASVIAWVVVVGCWRGGQRPIEDSQGKSRRVKDSRGYHSQGQSRTVEDSRGQSRTGDCGNVVPLRTY